MKFTESIDRSNMLFHFHCFSEWKTSHHDSERRLLLRKLLLSYYCYWWERGVFRVSILFSQLSLAHVTNSVCLSSTITGMVTSVQTVFQWVVLLTIIYLLQACTLTCHQHVWMSEDSLRESFFFLLPCVSQITSLCLVTSPFTLWPSSLASSVPYNSKYKDSRVF